MEKIQQYYLLTSIRPSNQVLTPVWELNLVPKVGREITLQAAEPVIRKKSKKATTVGEANSSKKATTVGEANSSKKATTVGEANSSKKATTVGEGNSSKKATTVGEGKKAVGGHDDNQRTITVIQF